VAEYAIGQMLQLEHAGSHASTARCAAAGLVRPRARSPMAAATCTAARSASSAPARSVHGAGPYRPASVLGMTCARPSPFDRDPLPAADRNAQAFDDLLEQRRHTSPSRCPLTEQTRGLIGRAANSPA
jgi:hypothetical protein